MRLILSVLAVGLTLLMSSSALAQRTDEADKKIYAQRHFEQALAHFDAGRYADALTAFRTSLDLYPSPNTRLYVARSLVELGATASAANAYEETIRSAELLESEEPRYAETADAARSELNKFRGELAQVQLAPAPDAAIQNVHINEEPLLLESLGLPIYTDPGTVRVVVTYESGTTREFRANASAGQVARIRIPADAGSPPKTNDTASRAPEPAPAKPLEESDDSSGLTVGLTVSAGVALVGLAGAVGFGLAAQSKYDALKSECGGPCPTDRSSDIADGKTYDALTNVGIVATAVGVASTTLFVLLLVNDGEDSNDEMLALTPGGVRVQW